MKKIIKRIIDLLLSVLAFILISPIFFFLILLLWAIGEHEIFYLKTRLGYHNKPFKMIKFATMVKNSLEIGTGSLTLRNDPRITKVGSFLRKTKLNELPQIINVILGHMSIVGPRPQMMVDFMKFPDRDRETLFLVKPGITGIGSIIFRDEEGWISGATGDKHEFYKQNIAPYKGQLELWYRKRLSFRTDFILIFLTAWTIISPKSNLVFKVFKDLPKKPEMLN